jgi:sulfatase modifying factor 1
MIAALLLTASVGLTNMVNIEAGEFRPLYLAKDSSLIPVEAFAMDRLPVTNTQYFAFVTDNPRWQKGNIPSIFADSRYLQHWKEGEPEDRWMPDPSMLENAVVNVSWFAAQAYCQSRDKHLPTVSQWEYAALASETLADGRDEPGYRQRILDWYAKHGTPENITVGQAPANYWGIHDMHGLIWEWTKDFNSALVSGESRADSAIDQKLFCAAGSVGAADPGDYAAFMRFGFRSSLSANYSLASLGFRCASSKEFPE